MAKQATKRTPTTGVETPIKFGTTPKVVTQTRAQRSPTDEQIRERAFQVYLRRNGGPGDAHSDWIQAERELRTELNR
jgi:hypothetical protein